MLKFAINMEKEIICQIENLEIKSNQGVAEFFRAFLNIERNLLELLIQADKIDIDTEKYPQIDAEKILGGKNTLLQAVTKETSESYQTICVLWMLYALIEKSAQYYRQASLNSAHPALKLFMGSLGEVKNIFRGRAAACVRMAHNDIWGEVGFAPFVLGKD